MDGRGIALLLSGALEPCFEYCKLLRVYFNETYLYVLDIWKGFNVLFVGFLCYPVQKTPTLMAEQ